MPVDKGEALTVREAARELAVAASTVQSWIRAGAPTCSLGSVGRGHGSRVEIEHLRQWRAQRALRAAAPAAPAGRCDLQAASAALWRLYTKPHEGTPVQFWRVLRLPRGEVAALLLQAFREIAREANGHPVEDSELPAEMRSLLSIFLDSLHRRIRP